MWSDLFAPVAEPRLSRSRRKSELARYCERRGLLPGQYAWVQGILYRQYFCQYGGVFAAGFEWLYQNDVVFRREFQGADADWALLPSRCRGEVAVRDSGCMRAMHWYSLRERMPVVWVPRHIHVLEAIQRVHPAFRWRCEGQSVVYCNYPRRPDGRQPSLYELVSAVLDAR